MRAAGGWPEGGATKGGRSSRVVTVRPLRARRPGVPSWSRRVQPGRARVVAGADIGLQPARLGRLPAPAAPAPPLRASPSAPAVPPPCLQCLRARVLAASPPLLPPSLSRAALRPTASNCAPPCIASSYWVLIIQKKMLISAPASPAGCTSSAKYSYICNRTNNVIYGPFNIVLSASTPPAHRP